MLKHEPFCPLFRGRIRLLFGLRGRHSINRRVDVVHHKTNCCIHVTRQMLVGDLEWHDVVVDKLFLPLHIFVGNAGESAFDGIAVVNRFPLNLHVAIP